MFLPIILRHVLSSTLEKQKKIHFFFFLIVETATSLLPAGFPVRRKNKQHSKVPDDSKWNELFFLFKKADRFVPWKSFWANTHAQHLLTLSCWTRPGRARHRKRGVAAANTAPCAAVRRSRKKCAAKETRSTSWETWRFSAALFKPNTRSVETNCAYAAQRFCWCRCAALKLTSEQRPNSEKLTVSTY